MIPPIRGPELNLTPNQRSALSRWVAPIAFVLALGLIAWGVVIATT